ncbi:MAG: serine/threonine-protein kinase [Myxococcota bacterium]
MKSAGHPVIRSNEPVETSATDADGRGIAGNAVGALFGNYRAIRLIASGGMGSVYEGRHCYTGRRVAIKVQHRRLLGDRRNRRRLLGEAVSTQRIAHAGIVQIFDYGHDVSGAPFLVMEYLDGMSLAERIADGEPLSLRHALDIARQLASIAGAAHRAGIVHRDLKPDNIYLVNGAHGVWEQVKLFDFGVAKFAGTDQVSSMHTGLDDMLGTPAYMSPEQCRSAASVDLRSDIYSLGCVLYEMVCGTAPFRGSIGDVLTAQCNRAPTPPRVVVPSLSVAVESFLLALLAKSPDDRPQTMDEVLTVLDALTAELNCVAPAARAVVVGEPTSREARGSRGVFGVLSDALGRIVPLHKRPLLWRRLATAAIAGAALL